MLFDIFIGLDIETSLGLCLLDPNTLTLAKLGYYFVSEVVLMTKSE